MIVIDDRLLLGVVAESTSPIVRPYLDAHEQGQLFTTGSWYWRLARALGDPGQGALSRTWMGMEETEQRRASVAMDRLPPRLGLLSLRRLVPVMAALPGHWNLLTAEAVATAIVVEGTISVTTHSELLARAAAIAGIEVDVVGPAR